MVCAIDRTSDVAVVGWWCEQTQCMPAYLKDGELLCCGVDAGGVPLSFQASGFGPATAPLQREGEGGPYRSAVYENSRPLSMVNRTLFLA